MKQVHIVPHMHWDREWYFSTEESRILLVNNMEEIMQMLETNPDYPYYVLDGQTAILEDYFAVKPENKERVRKLVQEGKLIIGPWYTQTDEMVVGAESIVRNLMYGIKDSENFGSPMMIGYLPDSFGQSSQMPQILNGFDIKYSIFWRGMSERHGTDRTEFYWESDDGSRVLVQLMPLGYAIGKYLPENEEELQERIDKYFSVLDKGATTDHILLPNGHDQMPVQKNIFDVIDKLQKLYPDREFFLSKYENLFAELEENDDLPTVKGEFLDGKYMRVHRSIFSTRMDIKAANTRVENKITNVLEPLASLAYSLGFEYHHGLIELIWKEIMKNHAHDSIGCCCSDKVHQEIANRLFIAEEKVDRLIEFYKRKIVDSMETDKGNDRLTAFNMLTYDRTEVVKATVISKLKSFKLVDDTYKEIDFEVVHQEVIDPGLIDRQIVHYGNYDPFLKYTIQLKDRIPSLGYKTYFIQEADSEITNSFAEGEAVDTDFYQITVNENGSLNIYDKRIGQTFENVLLLENSGDDGDEYDYSPLPGGKILYSDDVKAETNIRQNKYTAEIDIRYTMELPADLDQRKAGKEDGLIEVQISIEVPGHKPLINVKVDINNQARDHRLRALIPTGISADFSLSDNQFGTVKRSVRDSAMDVWETEKWKERPDPIYPMLNFVGLSNEDYGLGVLTNSTREFEIIGKNNDTIALTLFRSVGVLGKEELVRRPGRPSGIKLPTPDSQMLGWISLEFALVAHKYSSFDANLGLMAKDYLTPITTYNKIPHNAMKLNDAEVKTPLNHSLFEQADKGVVLSTLKKAECDDKLVYRYYNATDQVQKASLKWNGPVEMIYEANLNEKPLSEMVTDDGDLNFELKPNQVKTFLL